MALFVIYGVDSNGKVEHHVKECKKPTWTKVYKEMAKKFSAMEIDRFGCMPKKDFDYRKQWMDLK